MRRSLHLLPFEESKDISELGQRITAKFSVRQVVCSSCSGNYTEGVNWSGNAPGYYDWVTDRSYFGIEGSSIISWAATVFATYVLYAYAQLLNGREHLVSLRTTSLRWESGAEVEVIQRPAIIVPFPCAATWQMPSLSSFDPCCGEGSCCGGGSEGRAAIAISWNVMSFGLHFIVILILALGGPQAWATEPGGAPGL